MLPAAYREAWEEEMVATFLDGVDSDDVEAAEYAADFGRPSWSEVASVVGLAVRLRLGVAGASPRSVAWGQALRLVALMGLLVNAAAVTSDVGIRLWLSGQLGWRAAPPVEWAPAAPTGTLRAVWDLAGLLWLPAYVGVLVGQVRAARLLALIAVLADGVATVSARRQRPAEPATGTRREHRVASGKLLKRRRLIPGGMTCRGSTRCDPDVAAGRTCRDTRIVAG